jgi:hypothetical protein
MSEAEFPQKGHWVYAVKLEDEEPEILGYYANEDQAKAEAERVNNEEGEPIWEVTEVWIIEP